MYKIKKVLEKTMNKSRIRQYTTIYTALLSIRESLIDFLYEVLPPLSPNNWLESLVISNFAISASDNIGQRNEKKGVCDELKNTKNLSCLDISNLLKLTTDNIQKLKTYYNNSLMSPNRFYGFFSDKFKITVRKTKLIRDEISHANDVKLDKEKFKEYMKNLADLSNYIGVDKNSLEKMKKYNYKETDIKIVIINNKKRELIDFVENKVLSPALDSEKLNEDIKDSLLRTLIRFEITANLSEIYDFFNGALDSPRGKFIGKTLNDQGLKSFEDYKDEFNDIYKKVEVSL